MVVASAKLVAIRLLRRRARWVFSYALLSSLMIGAATKSPSPSPMRLYFGCPFARQMAHSILRALRWPLHARPRRVLPRFPEIRPTSPRRRCGITGGARRLRIRQALRCSATGRPPPWSAPVSRRARWLPPPFLAPIRTAMRHCPKHPSNGRYITGK